MTRDRLFKRAKCPTTSRLSDCFSTSDSNMSAALADMLPHGSGTSQGEEHGVLEDRGPLRRRDTHSPQATHRDCMHCSSSVAASLNSNAMRTDTHNKNFVSSDHEHAGKVQPSSCFCPFNSADPSGLTWAEIQPTWNDNNAFPTNSAILPSETWWQTRTNGSLSPYNAAPQESVSCACFYRENEHLIGSA